MSAVAFETHSADEVERLTDEQVLILYHGARGWITEVRAMAAQARRQLQWVETEMERRGIAKPRKMVL